MPIARQRILLPPGCWRSAFAALLRGELWEGEEIERLERLYASNIGVADAVSVPSARAGLRFILETLDLDPGSEVICSAFGYPVVPHLVRSLGFALRFVDCETVTLGMDPGALREAMREETGAVLVTHLYGIPCRIGELAALSAERDAFLIEDCAHCFAASEGGRRVGSFGDFGYFSFETSKMINTMGGGIVTVRAPERATRIRERIRQEPNKTLGWLVKRLVRTSFEAAVTHPLVFNTGVYAALRLLSGSPDEQPDRFASGYHADEISMRGRMGRYTNYQAGLGRRQVEALAPSLERRVANAERLIDQLRDAVDCQQPAGDHVRADYMLVAALFPDMPEVARRLLGLGIDTKREYMRNCARLFEAPGAFPNAERAERQLLHLPAYPQLSDAQIDVVATRAREVLSSMSHAGGLEVSRP